MQIQPTILSFKDVKAITSLLFCLCLGLLTGCSTTMPAPSKFEPTMAESYRAAMLNNANVVHGQYSDLTQSTNLSSKNIKIITPTLAGALQNPELLEEQARDNKNFPMLPNPQVMLYIFPHFQGDLPIHGNWTTFSLYSTNHYALPSEVNTGDNSNV